MEYIVLLGAGASYGSGNVSPYPPPLGNQLFQKLDELGGVASGLPEALKEKFRGNFETGMAEYYLWSKGFISSFQRELGYYLSCFTPEDGNSYKRLISSLYHKNITYCSLNYDLLFELSASQLGLGIVYDNKNKDGFVKILKIHGSSNFWPDYLGNTIIFQNLGASAESDIEAPVKPLSRPDSIKRSLANTGDYPAIAMYAEGKTVKVCPEYIRYHQKVWCESLKTSSKIFIIGVRVNQVDTHIWTEIANSNTSVYYFGFQPDEDEFIKWKNYHKKDNAFFFLCNFDEAIDKIIELT